MQKLTKAEEQLMQVIWKLEKAFLREIMEEVHKTFPPKKNGQLTKQSTISTLLKILQKDKNPPFIAHESFGKVYRYYPLIGKDEYAQFKMQNLVSNYFDGSFKKMLSFFSKQGDITLQELDELLGEVEDTHEQ